MIKIMESYNMDEMFDELARILYQDFDVLHHKVKNSTYRFSKPHYEDVTAEYIRNQYRVLDNSGGLLKRFSNWEDFQLWLEGYFK